MQSARWAKTSTGVEEVEVATIHPLRVMQRLVGRAVVVQVVCLVGRMQDQLERMVWEEEVEVGARPAAMVVREVMEARASWSSNRMHRRYPAQMWSVFSLQAMPASWVTPLVLVLEQTLES